MRKPASTRATKAVRGRDEETWREVQKVEALLKDLTEQATATEHLLADTLAKRSSSFAADSKRRVELLKTVQEARKSIDQILYLLEAESPLSSWASFAQGARRSTKRLVGCNLLLTSAQFIESLSWTRQALSKALAANRVFFVEWCGSRYYPSFLADPTYQRSQLEAVAKRLGELPGRSKLQFFLTPKVSLGGLTPLSALAKGQFSAVKASAGGFAER